MIQKSQFMGKIVCIFTILAIYGHHYILPLMANLLEHKSRARINI